MKIRRMKDKLVPFSAIMPTVAYERIRQEAKRRKVSIGKVITDLVEAFPNSPQTNKTRDMRLEKYGFSYENVDWSDEEQGCGVILAEFAMQRLPPSRRELQ